MDTKQTVVNETSAKIAAINDKHRQNMEGCTVTRGIVAMGDDAKEIFVKVRDFSDFNEDNDPYGEHDFGSFELHGQKIFWKLSCYGDRKQGIDQLDPRCERVLTVMLAEEW